MKDSNAAAPEGSAPRRNFYGRRHGRPLRDNRKRLMDEARVRAGEKALDGMLRTLEHGGYVTLDPPPPPPAAEPKEGEPSPPPAEPYRAERAHPTPELDRLLVFRGIHPLYGAFLLDHLGIANRDERIQAFESVLELPRPLLKHVRVPYDLSPGPLQTEKLDPELIAKGLITAQPPKGENDDEEEDEFVPWDERPPVFAEKLRLLFDAMYPEVGDFITQGVWAAGDMRSRGFLVGGTAGRTTLNGEGLQHEDGHSHLLAGAIPNCRAYDPTFSYEIAVVLQDGVRRMLQDQEDVYYYVTVMNENYEHPDMPAGVEGDIIKGMYLFRDSGSGIRDSGKGKGKSKTPCVQLLGSGTILREVIAAAELLEKEFGVASDIWSCPSFAELRRDGFDVERWNRLHPMDKKPRKAHVTACLEGRAGPAIAATDYVREFADQIRAFMPDGKRYVVLGTDGFDRSDTRANLRGFFEVDRYWIAHAAIAALAADGEMNPEDVARAIKLWKLDPDKPNPLTV